MKIFGTIVAVLALIFIIGVIIYRGNSGAGQMRENSVNEINEAQKLEINKGKNMKATIKTNKGDIVLELFNEQVPNTVGNFAKLANEGFYNQTKFHRVIDGFMIQGGDPLTKDDSMRARWGTGGPGYQFADEFADGLSNVAGTISMANAGPNTNGSQFFINVADNSFLDGRHAVFGKVVEGLDIVMEISKVERNDRDVPLIDVVLESVVVE